MSLSIRRAHERRMKQKAKRLGRSTKDANHLATCSCFGCGNQRQYEGATVKEYKAAFQLKEYEGDSLQPHDFLDTGSRPIGDSYWREYLTDSMVQEAVESAKSTLTMADIDKMINLRAANEKTIQMDLKSINRGA